MVSVQQSITRTRESFRLDSHFSMSESIISRQSPIRDVWIFRRSVLTNQPLLYVSRADVTPEVNAGGAVDVTVDVTNSSTSITNPFGDDVCSDGVYSGYNVVIDVDPGWDTTESVDDCIRVGDLSSPTTDRYTFDFPAPDDPGTYTVSITAVTPESGDGGTVDFEVVVSDDDDDAGDRPGDGGDDDPNDPNDSGGLLDGILRAIGIGDPSSGQVAAGTTILIFIILFVLLIRFG